MEVSSCIAISSIPELEVATIPLCIPLFNQAFAIFIFIEESDVPNN